PEVPEIDPPRDGLFATSIEDRGSRWRCRRDILRERLIRIEQLTIDARAKPRLRSSCPSLIDKDERPPFRVRSSRLRRSVTRYRFAGTTVDIDDGIGQRGCFSRFDDDERQRVRTAFRVRIVTRYANDAAARPRRDGSVSGRNIARELLELRI